MTLTNKEILSLLSRLGLDLFAEWLEITTIGGTWLEWNVYSFTPNDGLVKMRGYIGTDESFLEIEVARIRKHCSSAYVQRYEGVGAYERLVT